MASTYWMVNRDW